MEQYLRIFLALLFIEGGPGVENWGDVAQSGRPKSSVAHLGCGCCHDLTVSLSFSSTGAICAIYGDTSLPFALIQL